MVDNILPLFKTAFEQCVAWTNELFVAVDGSGVVISALLIVFVVSLIIIPLRGVRVGGLGDTASAISDFSVNMTHKYHRKQVSKRIGFAPPTNKTSANSSGHKRIKGFGG